MLTAINNWLLDRFASREWRHHDIIWKPVALTDGTVLKDGWAMRRRINGAWQYRALTPEEAEEAYAWWAIH